MCDWEDKVMYKISVPIPIRSIDRSSREQILNELKRFDAERVFLTIGTYETDADKREAMLEKLTEYCRFFSDNGYEVGTWTWSFWVKNNKKYRNKRSIKGSEIKDFVCPTDESFVKFAVEYIKEVAKTGVKIIQFDDDLRYGFLGDGPSCLCDGHIKEINRITGVDSTREELEKYITSGSKNKFRDAYLKVNGDALKNFAKAIRKGVDEINPEIRISQCSCMSSWDIDGTDPYEISKILAGNTKPIVRLIGAPYWAVNKGWGNSLQDVIELERMESAWTKKGEIEIMAEGDTFPRPRTLCPASYLEGFDTAIRVSGCTDGILKYGHDYYSNSEYEKGYADFHERNRENYKKIDKIFSGKESVGVRVYESMKKVSDMVMPTKVNDSVNIEDLFFSKAARTLAYNTIPTVYEGKGVCGIVFDENARNLPLECLENGTIIDIAAAEILMERGVDVGIDSIGKAMVSEEEYFINEDNHICTCGAASYDIKLKEGAEVLSEARTEGIPMSYRYENKAGNRFLVLNINTRSTKDNALKHYARSRQYAEQIEWLGGRKLPAYVCNNPAMYIQCKKDKVSMAVGLWNFFADTAFEPVVMLDKEYSEIEFVNCKGRLNGDKVYITDIAPFGFAAFEVK